MNPVIVDFGGNGEKRRQATKCSVVRILRAEVMGMASHHFQPPSAWRRDRQVILEECRVESVEFAYKRDRRERICVFGNRVLQFRKDR